MPTTPLTTRPAWKALDAHVRAIRGVHLRTLFADDPTRGERLTAEGVGLFLDYSKNRVTDETMATPRAAGGGVGAESPDRRHVPGREDQRHREPGRPPRCASRTARRLDRRGREERRPGRARGARQDGRLRRPRPQRRVERPHRQAHQERGQHRHRRLGPRARDGLRGAASLQRSLADLPVRLQRRRHRPRRSDARPRPGRDALHRFVEDVHDAGDDDQRAQRARLVARRARRRREGRGEALRRRLDECREGVGLRHRHGQHVRLLGLGGRPVLDGLGDRPVHDDRHRPGPLPRDARRLPPDGRALPHRAVREEPAGADGAAVGLVHELLRRPDRGGAAVRELPEALPRLPPATDHGEQRQAA